MSVIKWKECYETKIDSLDREHQRLVELINQLYEAIRNKHPEDVMQTTFDALLDYTKQHFSHEEKLLEEYNYPELELQREQHQKLAQEVDDYLHKLAEGNIPPAIEVMGFLRSWLLDHIVQSDLKYGPHLESHAGREVV